MKTLNGNRTNRDFLATCDEALRQYSLGDRTPTVYGVTFEKAARLGCCQANVRYAVEGTAYGKARMWGEASCCATSTSQRMAAHGWPNVGLANAQPGDVVYFGPGGGWCDTCEQDPGHVGILHHQDRAGVWQMWQNTVTDGLGLCCIPLRASQRARIVGVYRLFPLAETLTPALSQGERVINWWGTYLPAEAVEYRGGEHFVNLRKIAAAEGSAVKVSGAKVFVGPTAWWPE